jgi:hypothetical protein
VNESAETLWHWPEFPFCFALARPNSIATPRTTMSSPLIETDKRGAEKIEIIGREIDKSQKKT